MKILVVRFSAIGDCVMTAWAVSGLRVALPDSRIVWAVQDFCQPVLDPCRLVSSFVTVPRGRWKKARWSPQVWAEQVRLYTSLRRERFDVGFDFQGHSKTALLLRLAGCQARFSAYAKDGLAALLARPTQTDKEHIVEVCHHVVNKWHPTQLPNLPFMPEVGPLEGVNRPLATILTGVSDPARRYPTELWADVARSLMSRGLEVAALGGAGDPRLEVDGVKDLVGRLPLLESMAWIAHSQVHLAADTGSGHIAAAYGVPVVSLFSNKSPDRSRPWGDRVTVLRSGPDPSQISPADVTASAEAWLSDHAVSR